MEQHWTTRDYQNGDEANILGMYREVNGREMTLSHWKWKFTDNPFGEPIIKLLFDGVKLIGHYAIVPMNMMYQGKLVKAAFSVNTMTHPDYGRRGIFSYLAGETYRECQRQGINFVYGFPNENSYHGFVNRLGWYGFGKINVLERELPAGRSPSKASGANLSSTGRFDERVTAMWYRLRDRYNIIVTRTTEYLNWRFTEHPAAAYEKIIHAEGDGTVKGYMVLKIYHGEDGEIGHIVDILCVNDEVVVQDLLNYALDFFTERGVRRLSCWAPDGSIYARALTRHGFKRSEFNAFFGVRALQENNTLAENLNDLSNWHLTLGDLDVI